MPNLSQNLQKKSIITKIDLYQKLLITLLFLLSLWTCGKALPASEFLKFDENNKIQELFLPEDDSKEIFLDQKNFISATEEIQIPNTENEAWIENKFLGSISSTDVTLEQDQMNFDNTSDYKELTFLSNSIFNPNSGNEFEFETVKNKNWEKTLQPLTSNLFQEYIFKKKDINSAYILSQLRLSARYAWLAYCLNSGNEISKEVYVRSDRESRNEFIFYFRGEEKNLQSILQNNTQTAYQPANFSIHGSVRLMVHAGLFNKFKKARKIFLEILIELLEEGLIKSAIIVGHSLGGVYATFAALGLKEISPKTSITLYTFGEPRIGDRNFVNYFEKTFNQDKRSVYRVTHSNDDIPLYPSKEEGYVHHEREYWINGQSTIECISEPGEENKNCINGVSRPAHSSSLNGNIIVSHAGPYYGFLMNGRCII
ncbi:hypothetical protein G9A89_016472 [Geosiphon pyriformis]|nr:hypothetical protein G9A89_016472 [Geosiphon pyriformis]